MRGEDVRTPVLEPVAVARPTGTIGRPSRRPRARAEGPTRGNESSPAEGARPPLIPVEGVKPEQLTPQFDEPRGGSRRHEAIDILAPRGTPSERSTTAPSLDCSSASRAAIPSIVRPNRDFLLLLRAPGPLRRGAHRGAPVRKGQVIGYVGTSGNAPKTPRTCTSPSSV